MESLRNWWLHSPYRQPSSFQLSSLASFRAQLTLADRLCSTRTTSPASRRATKMIKSCQCQSHSSLVWTCWLVCRCFDWFSSSMIRSSVDSRAMVRSNSQNWMSSATGRAGETGKSHRDFAQHRSWLQQRSWNCDWPMALWWEFWELARAGRLEELKIERKS